MGQPTFPRPVKLLIALLSADVALFAKTMANLEQSYGPIDFASDVFPWDTTDYYRAEMGDHLLRKFIAFTHLIPPEELVRIKLETNEKELRLSGAASTDEPRRINLDPGYLDETKLVLASTKNQAHRLYLSQGIYAEVTLLYHHKAFHPFIYTYEDYRWPHTQEFFQKVRKRYLAQLREDKRSDALSSS
jgi:hypothetical protein